MINTNYIGPIKNTRPNFNNPIIYKATRLNAENMPYEHYTAFDNKGKILGIIDGKMETINPLIGDPFFPGFKKFNSFYVYYLRSHEHNFGNKLLDFVQIISKKNGGEGRFHLIASDRYNVKKPPHIFYRRYGMDSLYPQLINDLDKYIKGKIKLEDLETIDTPMYFIPKELKNKKSNNNKILNLIKNLAKKMKK